MIQSSRIDLQAPVISILFKFYGTHSNHITLRLNCSSHLPSQEFNLQAQQNLVIHLIVILLIIPQSLVLLIKVLRP